MTQDRPKTDPTWPNIESTWPNMSPTWPKFAPTRYKAGCGPKVKISRDMVTKNHSVPALRSQILWQELQLGRDVCRFLAVFLQVADRKGHVRNLQETRMKATSKRHREKLFSWLVFRKLNYFGMSFSCRVDVVFMQVSDMFFFVSNLQPAGNLHENGVKEEGHTAPAKFSLITISKNFSNKFVADLMFDRVWCQNMAKEKLYEASVKPRSKKSVLDVSGHRTKWFNAPANMKETS